MGDNRFIRFIHKDGKIVPIVDRNNTPIVSEAKRFAQHKGRQIKALGAAGHKAAVAAKHTVESGLSKIGLGPEPVHVRRGLDILGLGLSVVGGAVGAATFHRGATGFLGGFIANHAIDAAATGINIASVAGRGNAKERLKQGTRQELRNQVAGWGTFGLGLVALPKNRARLGAIGQSILKMGRKSLVPA